MLGTPPAFILSQDQTLILKFWPRIQLSLSLSVFTKVVITWSRVFIKACFNKNVLKIFLGLRITYNPFPFYLEFSGLFYYLIIKILFLNSHFFSRKFEFIRNIFLYRSLLCFCASARFILPRFQLLVNNFFNFFWSFLLRLFCLHGFPATAKCILSHSLLLVNNFF